MFRLEFISTHTTPKHTQHMCWVCLVLWLKILIGLLSLYKLNVVVDSKLRKQMVVSGRLAYNKKKINKKIEILPVR